MKRLTVFLISFLGVVAVALSPTAGSGEISALQGATGTIQGRLFSTDSEQTAFVLIVPASTPQPIRFEDYTTGGVVDIFQTPTSRSGPGLVKNGPDGLYSVTDLEAAEYLVGTTAVFFPDGTVPPEEIQTSIDGRPSTMLAFRVSLNSGETVTVDFALGSSVPQGLASVRVCARTFDRDTLEAVDDTVVSGDLLPTQQRPGVPAEITATLADDGCAVFANVPAGTYSVTVETSRGMTLTGELNLRGGDNGTVTLAAEPAAPGQLPSTGGGSAPASQLVWGIVGLALLAVGVLSLGLLRRRGI